jgi:hypothetical protein
MRSPSPAPDFRGAIQPGWGHLFNVLVDEFTPQTLDWLGKLFSKYYDNCFLHAVYDIR